MMLVGAAAIVALWPSLNGLIEGGVSARGAG
jgi:hypothetical protein